MTPYLSQKSLKQFIDCPRCFYIEKVHKIVLKGIFPSLPEGVDRIMKVFFNELRKNNKDFSKNMQALTGLKDINLFEDQAQLEAWQDYKKGVKYEDKHGILMGAIDEACFTHNKKKEMLLIPADFKTKGSVPFDGYSEKYHKFQLDTYDLIFQKMGYKTAGFGLIFNISPEACLNMSVKNMTCDMLFNFRIAKVATNPEKVEPVYIDACKCLKAGKLPSSGIDCNMCKFLLERKGVK